MTYHAKTWPLLLPPSPSELLGFLRRDGLAVTATDEELVEAYGAAGHDPEGDYFIRVLYSHRAARYEALTGDPF